MRLIREAGLFDDRYYCAQLPKGMKLRDPLLHYLVAGWKERLQPHPLFDAAWYARKHSKTLKGREPLVHYLLHGWKKNRQPHPLFDGKFYLESYPDVAKKDTAPLAHYLKNWIKRPLSPHPLFDAVWYRQEYAALSGGQEPLQHYLFEGWSRGCQPHPLFDSAFYSANHTFARSPLEHYCLKGMAEGASPNPLFDPAYYRSQLKKAKGKESNLFSHFLTEGTRQGLNPNALFHTRWYSSKYSLTDTKFHPLLDYIKKGYHQKNPNALFDSAWYLQTYPAANQSGLTPLQHYLEGNYKECQPNPLFDSAYYLRGNPDVAAGGMNPLAHYLEHGAREGRKASALFDTAWYIEEYPEIALMGLNPLTHYLEYGAKEGRTPHPLFSGAYYLERNKDVEKFGFNPLVHYLDHGSKEGRKPIALFDPKWYLEKNPDISLLGLEPLSHYQEPGWKEGRKPHALFDGAWYLQTNPDVAVLGMEPLNHYQQHGWKEGRSPHPLFDSAWYLQKNQDIAEAMMEPLNHYQEYGWKEGRSPHPLFDSVWYLQKNPEIAAKGLEPLSHYQEYGWKEGRSPHQKFDVKWYLEQNPDVASAGWEPLAHYVESGWKEGRDPHPLLAKREFLMDRNVEPLEHFVAITNADLFLRPASKGRRHWTLSEQYYGDIPTSLHIHYTPPERAVFHGMTDRAFFERLPWIEIVSFDIFDTALIRKVAHPTSVFDLLEQRFQLLMSNKANKFADLRWWAERQARDEAAKRKVSTEIGLKDIYDVIAKKLKLTASETEEMIQGELEEERRSLVANPRVLFWAKEAIKLGKKVIFISDMYLPSDFLVEVLASAGYAAPEVYVSCEFGAGKWEEKLFHVVSQKHGMDGTKFFHVGDNFYSDKHRAEGAGWRSAHYSETASEQPYALQLIDTSVLSIGSVGVSAGLGLSRVHRLNLERAEASFAEKLARNIGYELLGPAILGFTGWVAAQARTTELQSILFLARDGWLPYQVYQLLRKKDPRLCEGHYVWASRRLLYGASMRSKKDISTYLPQFGVETTLAEYLDILNLDEKSISSSSNSLGFGGLHEPVLPNADLNRYLETRAQLGKLINMLAPEVLRRAAEKRPLLRDYYHSFLADSTIERAALVDLGWAGSLVSPLENIIKEINPGMALDAYFFGLRSSSAHTIPASVNNSSYLFYRTDWCLPGSPLRLPSNDRPEDIMGNAIALFEILFSANHTTVIDLERKEKGGEILPVFVKDTYSKEQRQFLDEVHRASLEFVKDILPFLPDDMEEWDFIPLIKQGWNRLLSSPDEAEARFLGAFPHRVDASGHMANTTLLGNLSDARNKSQLWADWSISMWPNGMFAAISPYSRGKMLEP